MERVRNRAAWERQQAQVKRKEEEEAERERSECGERAERESRGRNNGRSSVNFRAFLKMTAHFSTCSVRVTDHVRIIAQLV